METQRLRMRGLNYFAQVEAGSVATTLSDRRVAFAGGEATVEEDRMRNNMMGRATTGNSADAVNRAMR
jgi:hypothetical protein